MVFKLSTDEKTITIVDVLTNILVLAACSDNSEDIDRYYATVKYSESNYNHTHLVDRHRIGYR